MQLSKEPRLFNTPATVDTSGKVKVEVPLPHWVLWGQPLNLFTTVDGTDPDRKADFKVLVQFSKDRQTTFAVNLSLDAPEVGKSGDSNYALASSSAAAYMGNGEQVIQFTPISNEQGRLAGMESAVIEDVTFDDAITCALIFARRLERILCVMTKVPLFVEVIQVVSVDTQQAVTRSSYPYPTATVSSFVSPEIGCMSPLLSLYAEGMRESSPFYRFLCFFKLVDKLLSKVNGTLRQIERSCGASAPHMNLEMPADPFSIILPSVVGKRYTVVRDEFQGRYRNVIAHLDLTSPIEPFNLDAEFAVAKGAMVLAYISEDLLRGSYDFLLAAQRVGYDVETIRFD